MQLTFPQFGEEEIALLRDCLESKWVTQGPLTERFEALIAARHRAAHVLATTSCTAALHLATAALGLGPGDEVVVPAFTWVTSAHAAEYVGAIPRFADVRADDFNLDPTALEAAITPRTRAIIVVHLFGLAAQMDAVLRVAQRHGLAVVEDAACAIGTTYADRPVGVIGDIGCFSFHPRKIVTMGEGGAVTTNRSDLADRVSSLRNHGATGLPDPEEEPQGPWTMARFDRLGFNLRLSDLQAAVGIAQMARLDHLLAERRAGAQRYLELLGPLSDLALPRPTNSATGHTYQSYVVRVREGGRARRNAVMKVLAGHGIQTRPGTHAVHRLGYYRDRYQLRPEDFPIAAASEDETIAIPLFPGMTEADQVTVATALRVGLAERQRS
jgi:dTDP-4-amino-4,6-dideoxygalactose transaminase